MSLCSIVSGLSGLASSIPDLGRSAFSGNASIASIASGVLGVTSAANAILDGVAGDIFSLRSQIPGIAAFDSEFISLSGDYANISSKLNTLQSKIYALPFDNKLTQKAWDLHSEFFSKSESLRAKATAIEGRIGLGGLGGIAGPLGQSQATLTAEYAQVVSQIANLSINDFKPDALRARANDVANQLKGFQTSMGAEIAGLKAKLKPEAVQARVKGGMQSMKSKFSSIKNSVASIGSC